MISQDNLCLTAIRFKAFNTFCIQLETIYVEWSFQRLVFMQQFLLPFSIEFFWFLRHFKVQPGQKESASSLSLKGWKLNAKRCDIHTRGDFLICLFRPINVVFHFFHSAFRLTGWTINNLEISPAHGEVNMISDTHFLHALLSDFPSHSYSPTSTSSTHDMV